MSFLCLYFISFLIVVLSCKYDKDDACIHLSFVPVLNTIIAMIGLFYILSNELSKWVKK